MFSRRFVSRVSSVSERNCLAASFTQTNAVLNQDRGFFKMVLPHQVVSHIVNATSSNHSTLRFDCEWPNSKFEVIAHPVRQVPYGDFSVEQAIKMIDDEKPNIVLLGTSQSHMLGILKDESTGDAKRTKRLPPLEYCCQRQFGQWIPLIFKCVAHDIPFTPVGMERKNMSALIGSKVWNHPFQLYRFGLTAAMGGKDPKRFETLRDAAPTAYAGFLQLPSLFVTNQIAHTLHLATGRPIDTKVPSKEIPALAASALTAGGKLELPAEGGKVLILMPHFSFPVAGKILQHMLTKEFANHPPNYPLMLALNFNNNKRLYTAIGLWAVLPVLMLVYALVPVVHGVYVFIANPQKVVIGGDDFILKHDQLNADLSSGNASGDDIAAGVVSEEESKRRIDALVEGNSWSARLERRFRIAWATVRGDMSNTIDTSRD